MGIEIIALVISIISGIITILAFKFKAVEWVWKRHGNQIRWFLKFFLVGPKLLQIAVAGSKLTVKQASKVIHQLQKAIDAKFFKLKGRKMNANLERPIQQVLGLENLNQEEKLTQLTIALYEDGSDERGLASFLMGNQNKKNIFLLAKKANPVNYRLVCGRLAIHIMAEDETKDKEGKANFQSYEIPWDGILEPFFKDVLDK